MPPGAGGPSPLVPRTNEEEEEQLQQAMEASLAERTAPQPAAREAVEPPPKRARGPSPHEVIDLTLIMRR